MVYYLTLQGRLDWERLIKEFLVEILLLFMYEHTSITCFIKARSSSSTYHLEQVSEREVYISPHLWIEELSALDDDQSSWEVYSPSQSARCNEDLDLLFDKKILNYLPIILSKTCMMHSHSIVNCLL